MGVGTGQGKVVMGGDMNKGNVWTGTTYMILTETQFSNSFSFNILFINLIALRKTKIVYNLGLSECNRVKLCISFQSICSQSSWHLYGTQRFTLSARTQSQNFNQEIPKL